MDDSKFQKKNAGEELIFYTEDGKDKNVDWKNCLSDTAVHNTVKFFHILLITQGNKDHHKGCIDTSALV